MEFELGTRVSLLILVYIVGRGIAFLASSESRLRKELVKRLAEQSERGSRGL